MKDLSTKRVMRMTPRQCKTIRARLADPEATLEKIGLRAGYTRNPRQHAWKVLNHPVIQRTMREEMDRWRRLKLGRLLNDLAKGLDAEETEFFAHEGHVIEKENCIAWGPRRDYLRLAFQLRGDLKTATEINVSETNILANLTDAQLALIARGKATPHQFMDAPGER